MSLSRNLRSDLKPEVEVRPNGACAVKRWQKMVHNILVSPKFQHFYRKSGSRSLNLTSDLLPEAEI